MNTDKARADRNNPSKDPVSKLVSFTIDSVKQCGSYVLYGDDSDSHDTSAVLRLTPPPEEEECAVPTGFEKVMVSGEIRLQSASSDTTEVEMTLWFSGVGVGSNQEEPSGKPSPLGASLSTSMAGGFVEKLKSATPSVVAMSGASLSTSVAHGLKALKSARPNRTFMAQSRSARFSKLPAEANRFRRTMKRLNSVLSTAYLHYYRGPELDALVSKSFVAQLGSAPPLTDKEERTKGEILARANIKRVWSRFKSSLNESVEKFYSRSASEFAVWGKAIAKFDVSAAEALSWFWHSADSYERLEKHAMMNRMVPRFQIRESNSHTAYFCESRKVRKCEERKTRGCGYPDDSLLSSLTQ